MNEGDQMPREAQGKRDVHFCLNCADATGYSGSITLCSFHAAASKMKKAHDAYQRLLRAAGPFANLSDHADYSVGEVTQEQIRELREALAAAEADDA